MKAIIVLLACVAVFAQEAPKTFVHAWAEGFATPRGPMLYPQYAWGVNTSRGKINGFGFVESAPGEKPFTNHLVWYTPPHQKMKWFSVQTETGGFPTHNLGFFQVGPRINVTEAIPKLRKPLAGLFVTALPRFIGIRPNNILVGGATNSKKVKSIEVWGEGYRRFFPDGSGYGEYWLMVKPTRNSPVSFGIIGHHVTGNSYPGIGIRYSFF